MASATFLPSHDRLGCVNASIQAPTPRQGARAILTDRTGIPSMLRWGLSTNMAALILGTPIGYAVAGGEAALSYATAVVGIAAFFTLGIVALKRLLAGPVEFALAAAMGVYAVQLSVVFGLLLVLRQAPWLHLSAFVAGAIGATIVWQAGTLVGLRRARQPVYEPHAPQ